MSVFCAYLFGAALLVLGSASQAQELANTEGRDRLEEVVVTAQKRSESLQNVPISVQVVGADELAEKNRNALQELTQTVPGVHVFSNSGQGGADMFIRGIGSGRNPFFEQSVSTFVDSIYRGRSRASAANFVDLERIEVLKGPQSTFFGNNAIAGAFNIVTRKPGDKFDAWARALYGDFGQYALEGAVGGPISDSFGARLAVNRNGSTGWVEDLNAGQRVPRVNNAAGRLTLDFSPSSELKVLLKTEASRHTMSGNSSDSLIQWVNCPPPPPYTPDFNGFCAQALALGVPIGLDTNQTSQLPGQGNQLTNYENVLAVDYERWGHTLSSVSGYYRHRFETNDDGQHLPQYTVTGQVKERFHQFSQELRFASPTGRTIEYMVGAYFQKDELDSSINVNLPAFGNLGIPALTPFVPLANNPTVNQEQEVRSIFGSFSWNVSDRLRLNTGLRGSRVEKDQRGITYLGTASQMYGGLVQIPPEFHAQIPFAIQRSQHFDRTDDAWMPSASIQYRIHPQAMTYVSYSRGFKAGGINGLDLFNPANTHFDPEYVNAYELGLKSRWLNDTLLVNLSAFRSDYKDLQVQAIFQTSPTQFVLRTTNAALSRSQGIELETQWAPGSNFRLTANATFLDSKYVDYPNASTTTFENFCAARPTVPDCVSAFPNGAPRIHDLSGRPTPYAPDWSAALTARYDIPFTSGYRFTIELSPYMTDSRYGNGNTDDPFTRVLGYTRLDGRLALTNPDRRWKVELLGKNLTDRVIATPVALYFAVKQAGRNAAVQFSYDFGGGRDGS